MGEALTNGHRETRLMMVLTENDALVDPRDVRGLVTMAVEAERCGIDGVQISDHVLLGPGAGALGRMENPRDYAAPGNQDPATAWPSSLVLMSAIAQATSTIRILAGAVIYPLRHPLILAKDLGTLDLLSHGRLIVLPTVSWHRDEYDALGIPFSERGRILDEQLEIMSAAWGPYPIRHEGHYFTFADVWLEPGAYHPAGPTLWFGGSGMSDALIRRLVRYGQGLDPFGSLSSDDFDRLAAAMRAAGRDMAELELVGGIRGTFDSPDAIADLESALESVADQFAQGYTTISFKPSMFVRSTDELPDLYRELIGRITQIRASVGPAPTR